jgi:hypothetical protein
MLPGSLRRDANAALTGGTETPGNVHRRHETPYSTPVDVLHHQGKRFLVSPRGQTQWARNARASRTVTLKQGRVAEHFMLQEVPDSSKPEILKAYLDRFKREVQRFFPVKAGSPPEAFAPLAGRYPAFELTPPQ